MSNETQSALAVNTINRSGEIATAAAAALSKATIEAKFVIALRNPRDLMQCRNQILDACKRPVFARSAIYTKPVGGQSIKGLSIRFAETAIQSWKNVDIASNTIFESEDQRLVKVTVTDLQTNLSYSDEVLLNKTVERRQVKPGQEVLSERTNSQGQKTFTVRATEDDLANKLNAAKSKCIRNSGLRLIPQDILEEAREQVEKTNQGGGTDTKGDIKKVCDAFASINVNPTQLGKWLGHDVETISPRELGELREIYTAIKDGEASWQDYMETKKADTSPDPLTNPKAPTAAPSNLVAVVDPDPVPMEFATDPKPVEAAKPVKQTPQAELESFVKSNGFELSHFVKAAADLNIKDHDSITAFSEITETDAKRLLRAKTLVLTGLKLAKEAA